MYPIICQIGPVSLYSYGLMLAIAVLVTGWLVARDAKVIGVSDDVVYDFTFWVVFSGIIGARLFFILLNLDYFLSDPFQMVMIQKGGLAWQGSVVAGLIAAVVYIKRRQLPLWKFLDIAAPYIALGHAIGRIGCFLNGCCYGKAASWGLYFPVWDARLQPTQLYMVAGQLAIFATLRFLQPRMKAEGQIFVWYLLLSAVERFLVEFARGDHDLYAGLSIFQYVCIGVFGTALAVNMKLSRKK